MSASSSLPPASMQLCPVACLALMQLAAGSSTRDELIFIRLASTPSSNSNISQVRMNGEDARVNEGTLRDPFCGQWIQGSLNKDAIEKAASQEISNVRWNKASHTIAWSERAKLNRNLVGLKYIQ
ncbi:hypothetical protein [Pseudomonas serbica]